MHKHAQKCFLTPEKLHDALKVCSIYINAAGTYLHKLTCDCMRMYVCNYFVIQQLLP